MLAHTDVNQRGLDMGRLIGGVVLGYITMAIAVFAGLSLLWMVLGTDGAFRPGSYDVSMAWALVSLVVGFGAALLGGFVSRRVSLVARGPQVLAAFVVVLGVLLALPVLLGAPEVGPRPETVGMFDAMQQAQTPAWIMLLNPLIGALGVLLGGGALGDSRSQAVRLPT